MSIDPSRFREAIRTIHAGNLSVDEAEAIVALAQLAVDADGREDPDEIKTFFTAGKAVYELTGMPDLPTPTFLDADDPEDRMRELAGQLHTPAAKDLAYAVAFVMAVSDVDVAPEEGALVEKLQGVLKLPEDRAAELAATISAAITPPA
jgi:hypothetical protein